MKKEILFLYEKREKSCLAPQNVKLRCKKKKRREVGKKCVFPVPGIEPLLGVSVGM